MEIKDFCNAGGDIMNAVAEAINKNDYSNLGGKITDTINDVTNRVKEDAKKANTYSADNKESHSYNYGKNNRYNNENAYDKKPPIVKQAIYRRHIPGTVTGPLKLACGITLMSGFGIAAFVMLLLSIIMGKSIFVVLTVVFSVLALSGIGFTVTGKRVVNLIGHFREYVSIIGQKGYVSIEELVMKTGRSRDNVICELQKMVNGRMFLQGRFDEKKTTLMLTDEAYKQYLETEAEYEKRKQQEMIFNPTNKALDEETKTIISEGKEYISVIHQCNEKIPDTEMTDKLYKLEEIMCKIFAQVEKHPENAENLHKFMNYYLPTTKKLLFAYIDLDHQPIIGENIQKTKSEIAESLDTINMAYENLLDDLFEDTAWDISSDISAMKTMMAQEGLTGQADFVDKK